MHYILLDEATIRKYNKLGSKRLICTLNKEHELHCAIMSTKDGLVYVTIGKTTLKKLKLVDGQKVAASFVEDNTEYQFEMPEELAEVLASDPEGSTLFHALTEGNQRGLIHLVSLVKSSNKRIERALKIVESVKQGISSPRLVMKK
ncbi:MAG: hypothetical protein RL660_2767 [Bacteroidota bacterium]